MVQGLGFLFPFEGSGFRVSFEGIPISPIGIPVEGIPISPIGIPVEGIPIS